MKKQLLTSSALVAVGAVAMAPAAFAQTAPKGPYITVNGYHEQILGAVISEDSSIADKAIADVHHETEIHFNGHVKLDNGITMRAHTELETNSDQGGNGPQGTNPFSQADYIDEIYLIIRGSFGQITIGSEDNAAHLMLIGYSGSWATGVGQNLAFDGAEWVTSVAPDFDTTRDSRLVGQDSDAEKISYYTPRFAGFQLGASYIPGSRANEEQNGAQNTATTDYHDGVAVGLNYTGKFDQIGIGGGIGYLHLQAPESGALAGSAAVVDDDMKQAAVALRLDFGPIRVSSAYKRTLSDETGGTDRRGYVIDSGVRYTMGPNMFSLVYSYGERQVGSIENSIGILSYARVLGPGTKWHANLFYTDSTSGATTNDGFAVSTGIRINF